MVPKSPCSSIDLVIELFGSNRQYLQSAKWANFHTNFRLIQKSVTVKLVSIQTE